MKINPRGLLVGGGLSPATYLPICRVWCNLARPLSLPGHYGKGGAAASVGPADSRSALLASCLSAFQGQNAPATVNQAPAKELLKRKAITTPTLLVTAGRMLRMT